MLLQQLNNAETEYHEVNNLYRDLLTILTLKTWET